jgi:hypothetical protein
VLHGADPGLIAELAVHRRLGALRLRRIAPTVLVSAAPPDLTLSALRAEGYAPVAEAADGTVRLERSTSGRAPAVPEQRVTPDRRPARSAPQPAELRSLAARLLAAVSEQEEIGAAQAQTEEGLADDARQLSPTAIRRLARAIHTEGSVRIEYLAYTGSHSVHTLSDLELDSPYLYARCEPGSYPREFALSRIQAVLPS